MIDIADNDKKIWRYMDFTKFVDMLGHQGLFFACLDSMSDPFEGFGGLRKQGLPWSRIDPAVRKVLTDMEPRLQESFMDYRQMAMVNCWHLNEFESAAMWAQYGKTTEAVAVQSTYGTLQNCLSKDDRIKVRQVEYGHTYPVGFRDRVFYKSKEFDHEREVRACIFNVWDASYRRIEDRFTRVLGDVSESSGIWIDTEMNELVEAVYVAPNSSAWFLPTVKNVLFTYGLAAKPVKSSALAEKPSFYGNA